MAEIIVKTTLGDARITPESIVGGFAVHYNVVGGVQDLKSGYTVTHIASGWAVQKGIASAAKAADLARRCGDVREWDELNVKVIKRQRGKATAARSSIPASLRERMGRVLLEWALAK